MNGDSFGFFRNEIMELIAKVEKEKEEIQCQQNERLEDLQDEINSLQTALRSYRFRYNLPFSENESLNVLPQDNNFKDGQGNDWLTMDGEGSSLQAFTIINNHITIKIIGDNNE